MDHRDSIQAAVDFIEERLGEELCLNAIAEKAAFSPWQFDRMFTLMVGMPVIRPSVLCRPAGTGALGAGQKEGISRYGKGAPERALLYSLL